MVQTLDVISVNIWQILISLCNLLIMFLILKHFLFKPVQNVLAKRQGQVDALYADAEADRAKADEMKQTYEAYLAQSREQADSVVRNATQTAQRRGEQIVAEASAEAARLKRKAEEEITQERRQMLADVRGEISDMAVSIAQKVVAREINAQDHAAMVDDFIRNVGDAK